ncbi:MAG: 30S ribosomal protein S20 [Amoebophilaceae bacterium]|nr:30S ribosomal protein S20 [Amoebophilaceae bacterium]
MANNLSAKKRIRSNHAKHLRNRYQLKTCKTFIKKLKKLNEKTTAEALLPDIFSMLDKLAARNVIHKNKSANRKAKLSKYVSGLTSAVVA